MFGKKKVKHGRSFAVIDFKAKKVLGVPLVSFDCEEPDWQGLIRKVIRECKRRGVERVAVALDYFEAGKQVAEFVKRRDGVPIMTLFAVNVHRNEWRK